MNGLEEKKNHALKGKRCESEGKLGAYKRGEWWASRKEITKKKERKRKYIKTGNKSEMRSQKSEIRRSKVK